MKPKILPVLLAFKPIIPTNALFDARIAYVTLLYATKMPFIKTHHAYLSTHVAQINKKTKHLSSL